MRFKEGRRGSRKITGLSKEHFNVRELFMFVTSHAFNFSKAAPPRIEFVNSNGNIFKVWWNTQKNLVFGARISIVKFDAFITKFVSFGSSIGRQDFNLYSGKVTWGLSIKKRDRSKGFAFSIRDSAFATQRA